MRTNAAVNSVAVFAILIGAFHFSCDLKEPGGPDNPGRKSAAEDLQWQFEYDDAGRLISVVDPAGRETKLRYAVDDLGRVRRLKKTFADGKTVTFTRDRFGRRVGMDDAQGAVRYEYDGFGRLTRVRRAGGPALSYTYDTLGRVRSIDCGHGLMVGYFYDFQGRIAKIDTPAGSITYRYEAGQGRTIRTFPNATRTIWESTPDGGLKSIKHVGENNRVLAQFDYSYLPAGLVSTISEWTPRAKKEEVSYSYSYDKANRITGVTSAEGEDFNYRYDALGKLAQLSAPGGVRLDSTYDWAGRLIQHGGQDCASDAAGNVTAYTRHTERIEEMAFTYTTSNGLASVRTARGDVHYRYDGDGRLISRTAGATVTRYVPDPLSKTWRPLLVLHQDGTRQLYVWDPAGPMVSISEGNPRFFLVDHLGSVRLVTNAAGQVVQYSDYTPLGVPPGAAEDDLTGRGLQPAFAGLFFDPETSTYFTLAGAYDPWLGRFLQHDRQSQLPRGLPLRPFSRLAAVGGG